MNIRVVGWFTLLLVCTTSAATRAQVPLIEDGKPVAKLYTAGPLFETAKKLAGKGKKVDDVSARLRSDAVRELNDHLEKMSGARLEIVVTDDPGAVRPPALVLGELAAKLGAAPKSTASRESFRLLTKDSLVLVAGESEMGTLHGVYELLNRLGCDWVMPGPVGEVIPRRKTVKPGPFDETQTPDFVVRSLWYRGGSRMNTPEDYARFAEWMRRHRASDPANHPPAPGGHVWDAFIAKHKAEFAKDPTMLALRRMSDGTFKRSGPQLESTHPRVVDLFMQNIRDAFAKNKWPNDKVVGFGIGPADGLGYSESAESRLASSGRIDPIMGAPDTTDLVVLLGNEILKRIEKEYPNVTLGFYSYSTHADYPARYKPHPKLCIIFADINFSRFHGFDDSNSKTRAYYKGVVEQWGKLSRDQGNPLFFRGYNWNLAENMVPFTRLKMWGADLPFYKKAGVVGCNVEATKSWSVNGPHDYLYMKLLWNTSQDWQKVLHAYCDKAFGEGSPAMERYYRRLVDIQHGCGQEAGSYHAIHLIFDDAFIAQSEKDLQAARTASQLPQEKTRIDYAAHALEALKLYLGYHRQTMAFDFAGSKKSYDAMLAHWEKGYAMGTEVVAKEVPQYLKRFLAGFVEEGLKYSTDPYQIVYRLPDELPTLLDPNEVGHRLRYQSPEFNDTQCIKTKTFSTTWDAQGLTGYRSGAVWYRVRFKLPSEAKGKPIGLFIGGVEDEARIWINGQVVGTSGQRFSNPAAFDLTEGIRHGQENLLAIQVIRNSAANEIGVGGILRPSFIFTGPQLATKAPRPLELRRILPGGELGEIER
jgi:hypothetical protein